MSIPPRPMETPVAAPIASDVRASEAWNRALTEHMLDIVTVLAVDGTILYESPAMERTLGHRPEAMLGRSAFEFVHPDDLPRVLSAFGEALATPGGTGGALYRFRHVDGHWVWLESIGRNLAHDPVVRGVVINSRDVDARERSILELRESEERYRLVVSSLAEGVTLVDAEGKVRAFNDAAANIYGFVADRDLEAPLALAPFKVLDEAGVELTLDQRPVFVAMRERRDVRVQALRILRADGTERWISVFARPLFRPGESQAHLAVSSVTDITERRKLEELLLHTQKMEAVGRLAGGVAHDFNNLLTAVRGYGDLLLQQLAPGDPLRAHVEQIRNAGDRAAELTRQLLAFSRRQRLEPRVLDLRIMLAEAQEMLQRVIGEHIVLRVRSTATHGAVRADRGQLEQIVLNLALNARDAMPQGGMLTLELRDATLRGDERGLVLEAPPGEYVVLTVRDSGSGMEPAMLQHIFEPFFTTKAAGSGTGLGLASVYGIVQQSGGTLGVQSVVGEGTTFEVWLPASDVPAEAPGPPSSSTAPRGRGVVLVVEDEPMVRALVSQVLFGAGYDVRTASNADEALALVRAFRDPVDLLVSDIVMPGMHGVELAARLRERWPGLRVLHMTGYSDPALLAGTRLEATHLLEKPFSPDQLLARVREIVGVEAR